MAATDSSIVSAESVTKTVASSDGELHILKNISLLISRAESVAIVGSSGSGKTTLLSLLAGLDLPSSGSIHINGAPFSSLDEDARARVRADNVGFIFQSFQLLPGLTALENVMLPVELGASNADARSVSKHYLEKVGLSHRLQHYPRHLSGGEQQRVAVARAFASHPMILFADEPTGNLDTATGKTISDLLFELNKESDTTLVLVTHEQRLAARCQRQITLSAGEIISDLKNATAAVSAEA